MLQQMPDSFGIPGTLGFRILDSGFRDSGFRGLGFGFGFNLNFHPKKYVKWWPDTAFKGCYPTYFRFPDRASGPWALNLGRAQGGSLMLPKGSMYPK